MQKHTNTEREKLFDAAWLSMSTSSSFCLPKVVATFRSTTTLPPYEPYAKCSAYKRGDNDTILSTVATVTIL